MDAKEKRKRVMSRSMRLGHCVCDPRKPCPCPLFKEKNVCTCAGERAPVDPLAGGVRLTEYVRSAGCASKISQKDLYQVLSRLPPVEDPRLLVGLSTGDDAGVFRLSDDATIVQTVDVLTPTVDDPYLFGRIAACNSLSDVYAMGGTPVTALSIIGFPIYALPHDVMAEILRGAMDVLREADTVLVGGHSINDEEIKFGLAVTGLLRTSDLATNARARPGDLLTLSKPLGTGILSLAHQLGRASSEAMAAAARSMGTLNRTAADVMRRHHVSACTDITGFGLLGHLCRLAIESRVTAEVWCDGLPLLPGAMDYAAQGMFSGANERNAEFSADRTEFADGVSEAARAVLHDAQTSGGLLMALPPGEAEAAVQAMRAAGLEQAAVIGRIMEPSDGRIRVRPAGTPERMAPATTEVKAGKEAPMSAVEPGTEEHADECCGAGEGGAPADAMSMFQKFMGLSVQPGAVDVVTKELVAVALGLAVNCVPCTRIHLKKALEMGISREELEEVAALAVGFGGCRAMMLWGQMKKELLGR